MIGIKLEKECRVAPLTTVRELERDRNRSKRAPRLLNHSRLRVSIEVIVICSQDSISEIAARIETAYRRKYPRWVCVGLTPGVWESAASRLLGATRCGSGVPVDPELFVAVQARGRLSPDPWSELTQRTSIGRYIRMLRQIICQLQRELRSEVRRAECRLHRGLTLDQVLAEEGGRLSPLACYILAHRAGRADLSSRHRPSAENQHRSCPLYRLASRSLLPSHAYPACELEANRTLRKLDFATFSVN